MLFPFSVFKCVYACGGTYVYVHVCVHVHTRVFVHECVGACRGSCQEPPFYLIHRGRVSQSGPDALWLIMLASSLWGSLSLPPEAGIAGVCHEGSTDMNSGSHALPTEPSPQAVEFSDSKRV